MIESDLDVFVFPPRTQTHIRYINHSCKFPRIDDIFHFLLPGWSVEKRKIYGSLAEDNAGTFSVGETTPDPGGRSTSRISNSSRPPDPGDVAMCDVAGGASVMASPAVLGMSPLV